MTHFIPKKTNAEMGSGPSSNISQSGSLVGTIFDYSVDFMDEIGRGSFGTVFKGRNKENEPVAVKKITVTERQSAAAEAMKSYHLMSIEHQNILKVFDVKFLNGSMWIMMDYCDLGDLNNFFIKYRYLVQDILPKIKLMTQIMRGIAFLHSKDIVHRDIKPGNILVKLEDDLVLIKLGDFGLVKILDPDSSSSAMNSDVGTFSFKAPEFWNKEPPDGTITYHRNIDVYAAGLAFAAMLQSQPDLKLVPLPEGSLQHSENQTPIGLIAHNRLVNNQPDVVVVKHQDSDNHVMIKIKDLIQGMTHVSAQRRLSSSDVVESIEEFLSMVGHLISNKQEIS